MGSFESLSRSHSMEAITNTILCDTEVATEFREWSCNASYKSRRKAVFFRSAASSLERFENTGRHRPCMVHVPRRMPLVDGGFPRVRNRALLHEQFNRENGVFTSQ